MYIYIYISFYTLNVISVTFIDSVTNTSYMSKHTPLRRQLTPKEIANDDDVKWAITNDYPITMDLLEKIISDGRTRLLQWIMTYPTQLYISYLEILHVAIRSYNIDIILVMRSMSLYKKKDGVRILERLSREGIPPAHYNDIDYILRYHGRPIKHK